MSKENGFNTISTKICRVIHSKNNGSVRAIKNACLVDRFATGHADLGPTVSTVGRFTRIRFASYGRIRNDCISERSAFIITVRRCVGP